MTGPGHAADMPRRSPVCKKPARARSRSTSTSHPNPSPTRIPVSPLRSARNGRSVLATFSQTEQLASGVELEVVNQPITALADAAAGSGSVLVPIDPDGIVRHAPRTSAIRGDAVPSLARAALEIAAPQHRLGSVREASRAPRTTLIDYRRLRPAIPRLSYVDLLTGEFDPALVDDRVVFIGATAAEFQDLWATPIDPALPGVFIQALAYRTAVAELEGQPILERLSNGKVLGGFTILALLLHPFASLRTSRIGRLLRFGAAGVGLLALSWAAYWHAGLLVPVSGALLIIAFQYALGIESLQRRIQRRAAAQESSLVALARLGDESATANGSRSQRAGSNTHGLELALELLGEIVHARAAVLIRATQAGRLTQECLEWRPASTEGTSLSVDFERAQSVLDAGKAREARDPEHGRAPVLYAPLIASAEPMGVLVVYCEAGGRIDALARRTIATVGAQMALTAQNLQLIEKLRETFESSIAAVAGRSGGTRWLHGPALSTPGCLLLLDGEAPRHAREGDSSDGAQRPAPRCRQDRNPRRDPEQERRALGRRARTDAKTSRDRRWHRRAGHRSRGKRRCTASFTHHERWDGNGYPEGLAADEIPLAARIVSIVDVWDALSTQRPYKKAFTQEEVRDLLIKGRGTQFDPELVDLFFEVLHDQGDEMLELIARSCGTDRIA